MYNEISMKVLIFTEGSKNIGFGHITRSISIYKTFEEKGIRPKIILNADSSVKYLVKNIDYTIVDWIKNREVLKEIKNSDIVLIDSYLANKKFYQEISETVKISAFIDDNRRLDYPKGIVINGNIHAFDLNYPKKEDIKYLLGTKYTPLRKEFWSVAEKNINEDIENILITFGGSDGKNMTPKILDLLTKKYPNLKKNIVIGKGFKNIDEIKRVADKNSFLFYNASAKDMKNLMLKADLAISAGGQTLYEIARVGVPTIAVTVADNQLKSVKKWNEVGSMAYAGYYNEKDVLNNVLSLLERLKDKKIREKMSKIGRKNVDGRGSKNIVSKLLDFRLKK